MYERKPEHRSIAMHELKKPVVRKNKSTTNELSKSQEMTTRELASPLAFRCRAIRAQGPASLAVSGARAGTMVAVAVPASKYP